MALSPGDPYSYARPDLAVVTRTHLELYVNFDKKILTGQAILTIRKISSTTEVILDNYGLNISSVKNSITGSDLKYQIGDYNDFGREFTIQLPKSVENNSNMYKIQIEYETGQNSPALHWLHPAQTVDGTHPFLLANSKLIYARAMFPCQDTPSVKSRYSATITVSTGFKVIMSAPFKHTTEILNSRVYEFFSTFPMPSNAVVIVVGSLRRRQLSHRSYVFAENKYIHESEKTFAKIEDILDIAEELCGTYYWGIFNICVLPPSISDVEIECPHVAFVSSTLLRGDRSLVSSIARNISQSWTVHLVTCANYEHLWLNKSFTIFIYRKIVGSYIDNEMRLFLTMKGSNELKNMIENLENTGLLKSLLPNLTGLLPANVIQYVPYEKGYMLLSRLQVILGGAKKFEPFLKSYLKKFAFRSIKTDTWKEYLYHYFSEEIELLNCFNWDMWFYKPGLPPYMLNYSYNVRFIKECYDLAEKWTSDYWIINSNFILDIQNFNDLQKIIFLNRLRELNTELTEDKMRLISLLYSFDRQNCEIRFAWLRLCIKCQWIKDINSILDFAIEYPMQRFIYIIFRDLYELTEMGDATISRYTYNRWQSQPKVQIKLKSILHLD